MIEHKCYQYNEMLYVQKAVGIYSSWMTGWVPRTIDYVELMLNYSDTHLIARLLHDAHLNNVLQYNVCYIQNVIAPIFL